MNPQAECRLVPIVLESVPTPPTPLGVASLNLLASLAAFPLTHRSLASHDLQPLLHCLTYRFSFPALPHCSKLVWDRQYRTPICSVFLSLVQTAEGRQSFVAASPSSCPGPSFADPIPHLFQTMNDDFTHPVCAYHPFQLHSFCPSVCPHLCPYSCCSLPTPIRSCGHCLEWRRGGKSALAGNARRSA